MKRELRILTLLLCCLGIFSVKAETPAAFTDMSQYEKTVLLIKYYETMHYGKGRYIGYGHQIQPGEKYSYSQSLSKEEADLLLRRDVLRIYNLFKGYGKDAWLLTALSYNVGPYAILGTSSTSKSELLRMIESGERNIRDLYLQYCHYQGKWHKGLYMRRLMELKMLYEE